MPVDVPAQATNRSRIERELRNRDMSECDERWKKLTDVRAFLLMVKNLATFSSMGPTPREMANSFNCRHENKE